MPTHITTSHFQRHMGAIRERTGEDDVVLTEYGHPASVVMSYARYLSLQRRPASVERNRIAQLTLENITIDGSVPAAVAPLFDMLDYLDDFFRLRIEEKDRRLELSFGPYRCAWVHGRLTSPVPVDIGIYEAGTAPYALLGSLYAWPVIRPLLEPTGSALRGLATTARGGIWTGRPDPAALAHLAGSIVGEDGQDGDIPRHRIIWDHLLSPFTFSSSRDFRSRAGQILRDVRQENRAHLVEMVGEKRASEIRGAIYSRDDSVEVDDY